MFHDGHRAGSLSTHEPSRVPASRKMSDDAEFILGYG
jgi:hypothetical protein